MSSIYLNRESIKLNQVVSSWQEAIVCAGDILVANNIATNEYTQAMINIVEEFGAYIVIFEGVALAHAKHEHGVLKTGASLITLKDAIEFGNEDNDPVKIVIAIAGENHEDHLYLLQKLADVFSEDGKNRIMECSNEEEILNIFLGDD